MVSAPIQPIGLGGRGSVPIWALCSGSYATSATAINTPTNRQLKAIGQFGWYRGALAEGPSFEFEVSGLGICVSGL